MLEGWSEALVEKDRGWRGRGGERTDNMVRKEGVIWSSWN